MNGCGERGPHVHDALPGAEWQAAAIADLKATGHRLTPSRLGVLARVAASPDPFTAEDLARAWLGRGDPGSRATVYRLVGWLEERGWLGRVVGPNGGQHALARELPGHYPAVCTACGAMSLVGGLELAGLVNERCGADAFLVERVRVQIDGRCPTCQVAGPTR